MGSSGYDVRPATEADARWLAPSVRADDAAELMATGQTPLDALLHSLSLSDEAFVLTADGEPLCLFGFVDLSHKMPGWAGAWAISGEAVERHKRAFIAASWEHTERALSRWLALTNFVDARYVRSIRWLEKMGAEFLDPISIGKDGVLFRQFVLTRKSFEEA